MEGRSGLSVSKFAELILSACKLPVELVQGAVENRPGVTGPDLLIAPRELLVLRALKETDH